jgi:L-lactate dehydrogenase (cytochrome)
MHRLDDHRLAVHRGRRHDDPDEIPSARVPLSAGLSGILSLDDFERAARARLPRPIFAYVSGGAEDNVSRDGNRAAFDEYAFIPRILTDVSKRSAATSLFGHDYALPVGIAPMGIAALSVYRGDLVLARAARTANIPMVLSGTSLIRLEEVAAEHPGAWFQAYLPGEPARIAALIDRVAAAGFATLMITVDVAVLPSRENNVRAGFTTPLRPSLRLAWDGLVRPRWLLGTALRTLVNHGMPHFENSFAERGVPILARSVERDLSKRDHLNWSHLAQIRQQWKGRLVVKGIMSAADARMAREHGVDGVIVSNHGGRQLEGTPSPLRVLPEVVREAGSMTVMMDSGVRRGTHVLKALALGAKFVFVGRPFNYAAAVGGEAGVAHAIRLLAIEVDRDMALLGINSLAELGPERLLRL